MRRTRGVVVYSATRITHHATRTDDVGVPHSCHNRRFLGDGRPVLRGSALLRHVHDLEGDAVSGVGVDAELDSVWKGWGWGRMGGREGGREGGRGGDQTCAAVARGAVGGRSEVGARQERGREVSRERREVEREEDRPQKYSETGDTASNQTEQLDRGNQTDIEEGRDRGRESETETETGIVLGLCGERQHKSSLTHNSACGSAATVRQRHTQPAEIDTAAMQSRSMRTHLLLSLCPSSDGVEDQVLANDAGLRLLPLHLKSQLEMRPGAPSS